MKWDELIETGPAKGPNETDEQLKARIMARRPFTAQPTRDAVREMSIESLRDIFEAGGFDVTVSWDDLLKVREG